MKSYLFIGGCPRSGTSLLSSLIGNISGVGVVQDLTALYQLKSAALLFAASENGATNEELYGFVLNNSFRCDLRTTQFFDDFLSKSLNQCLNAGTSRPEGRLLRRFLSCMDIFLFHDYNTPDPRKDRSSGSSYLKNIDLDQLLRCDSMRECFLQLLHQSCLHLSDAPTTFSEISLICEKTPENNVAIDVISMLMNGMPYNYINLVRDPVSVFGARKQRVSSGVEDFVAFHKYYSEPAFQLDSCSRFATVRYEDLIQDPVLELKKVFSSLGLSNSYLIPDGLANCISPGKYVKYVGDSIDIDRDKQNRSMVSSDEASYIYEHLSPFCEKYLYGRSAI